ncbi:RICIN domain-containing protein, partial [Nonomuraea sp. RK-328]|nr:RICIN domain-containing protein [Nonomuraea sp. RK-328]
LDGTRIAAKSEWRCRRQEIKKLAEKFVYGEKPAKPASVTGTVSRTGITVNVPHNGRSAGFSASVDLPSGSGPFPAVVVLSGFGADTATIKASGGGILRADATGVTGCSRFGKGAFVIGAFDQRIALTMPIESGSNNLCLGVTATGNTSAVTIATCNGQATQRWTRA